MVLSVIMLMLILIPAIMSRSTWVREKERPARRQFPAWTPISAA